MMLLTSCLQIAGLLLTVIGSWILLCGLFITDEEIEVLTTLTTLPISASNCSHERDSHGKDISLATTDPERLKNYRSLFLSKRKEERRKGRCALWLFIGGFALQAAGLFFAALPDLLAWVCDQA
jgi:hypothetical protein